ncbi:MAG: hypothetical protein ACLFNB_03720 [Candidatus Woesearchaeota archaeon]
MRNIVFLVLIIVFIPLSLYLLAIAEWVVFGLVALGIWFLSRLLDRYLPV